MNEFDENQILSTEDLLIKIQEIDEEANLRKKPIYNEIIRRSEPEKHDFKDRLGNALNSQIYNIYVYTSKHNPKKRDLSMVFPESTVNRAIYELELAKVIEERNGRYYIIF